MSAKSIIEKGKTCVTAAQTALLLGAPSIFTNTVYASGSSGYANNTTIEITVTSTDQLVSMILNIILRVATFIGAALLLWGIVMFGLAIKNDEPESKQKALMTAFAGVVLITIRSILTTAGIIS